MTNSTIAIKGNYLSAASEIFENFRYQDLRQDKEFNSYENFNSYLFDRYFDLANKEIALRGIWAVNGWTIINDPEIVDTMDDEALLRLSNKLACDVLTFVIQTTSGSYGFARYNQTKQRQFFVTDGKLMDNTGSITEEEQGLNLNDHVFADDIINLANNFGIDIEGKTCQSFVTKQLGYSEEMKKELEEIKQAQTGKVTVTSKPWWKIW